MKIIAFERFNFPSMVVDHLGGRELLSGDDILWNSSGNRLHADYRPVVFQEGRLWVESVAMAYSSNKISGDSGACVLDPKKIGRRSVIESDLLDDLVAWMVHSGVLGNDPLFTRRYPQSRIRFLRRRDVDGGIKKVCRAFGLDESRFSTKSLRSGFSTACTEAERHEWNSVTREPRGREWSVLR
eukprot:gene36916-48162_t